MEFEVRYVEETALPEGQPWVIGITHRGERFLFIKHGAAYPVMIEDAWRAGHALPAVPAQRRHERPELRVAI